MDSEPSSPRVRNDLVRQVAEALGDAAAIWQVELASTDRRTTIALHHPASHGRAYEGDTTDLHALLTMVRHDAEHDPEFRAVRASPMLSHPELVLGLLTLVSAFDWGNQELRALAVLLSQAGALSRDEAGWLAGYIGRDAPMTLAT